MTPKEQALYCINHGIHVVAGYQVGKSERAIIKGTAEGTLSKSLVCAWFDEIPSRNILINLKNSGLICIDLDQHKDGQNGVNVFNALWKTHNKDKPLNTYVEKTPTGAGVHIFFKVPADVFDKPIVSELADGVEVKHISHLSTQVSAQTAYINRLTKRTHSQTLQNALVG